jgi:high-affinity Fe2+/Pb2+ permease
MTALAMIIGMTPMALGLGEGGEQNAPLGRAVIGGLIFATVATLIFVPVVFSMVHKKQSANPRLLRSSFMQPEKKPSVSPGKIKLVGMIAASVLGVVVVTGIISRSRATRPQAMD